ncbi:MAG: ABC transporter substrate-binding protein [Acidisphaera sp.]|nr:ABC transporter substrate-binding protein [Acidisphaera sp.]
MKRRDVLTTALAGAAVLAAPRVVRADSESVLTFIPQADLASLDPVWTTADVTRNHAFLVFDTLYGLDDKYQAQPQMVQGHALSDDKKQWDLTLRPGLKFHDGTPVLARDCAASIQRWWKRDTFGTVLAGVTDEVSAASDTVIRFRLKRPFALLPDALAVTTNMCCIMPERLARTDPFQQVTEMVGSGPFRFVANERITGSRIVYEKFAGYVPRPDGIAQGSAGPKTVHFDRVVWNVVPDPATSSSALSSGEADWWENPTIDLVPQLKGNKNLVVVVKDHTGEIGCLRFNELFPPFSNPALRRIVTAAVNQRDFMEAVAGAAPELIKTDVGVFVPGTPMASTIGTDMMVGLKDPEAIKKQLAAAGYNGERIVVLAASNYPTITAIAEVGADMMKRIGLNIDYQSLDWGTVVQRRASKEPIDKGGWNIFFTFLGGTGNVTPASNIAVRATGGDAWFGWPNIPSLEAIRQSWFNAPDLAAQQKICEQLQTEFWKGPTYAPLGMYFQPTAFRSDLKDIPEGIPQFYRVKKA